MGAAAAASQEAALRTGATAAEVCAGAALGSGVPLRRLDSEGSGGHGCLCVEEMRTKTELVERIRCLRGVVSLRDAWQAVRPEDASV